MGSIRKVLFRRWLLLPFNDVKWHCTTTSKYDSLVVMRCGSTFSNRKQANESFSFSRLKFEYYAKRIVVFVTGTVVILGGLFVGSAIPVAMAEEKKDSDSEVKEESGKRKTTFKERKFITYENRLRKYSTPDRTFRYFATLQVKNVETNAFEVFMTPDDFIRSITPGAMPQPENLRLDSYRNFDPKREQLSLSIPSDSVFRKLGSNGLLSFSDYVFLLTFLSTPWRYFEIAFKMFDLNGDGDVSYPEFERVQRILRGQTAIGQRHRDTSMTGNVYQNTNSDLAKFFFGSKLEGKLTVSNFKAFHTQFMNEVLKMEFENLSPDEKGKVGEIGFAKALLEYAGLQDSQRKRMLRRVKDKFKESEVGITQQDYMDFFRFLHHISDVDAALRLYTVAGNGIERRTLKRVAKIAGSVDLTDHLIDVVFTLFDDNGDDRLSQKEFISIMKQRVTRGLEKPKDTGLSTFLSAIFHCTKTQLTNRASGYYSKSNTC